MNRTFSAVPHLAVALAAVAVLTTACSGPPAPPRIVKPVFVTTVTEAMSAEARSQTRSFSAVVRARVETELGFRTGGKVVDRLVEVGDAVKAGQALARLDPADHRLAVNAAADQVQAAAVDAQQAASDEARLRRLLADGSVGSADHERQKARADAAAARLEQARRQLDLARNREGYATLVAPFAGVVTALRFEHGQVVAEGQPVMSVARNGEREIVADLPEDWVGRVRSFTASATPWHDKSSSLRLVVREVSPVAQAPGRTFRVRYAAAPASRAAAAALPLGSTMQLNLSAQAAGPAAAVLPVSALVKASGPPGVWVLDAKGSGLVFQAVQVVRMDDASVHVAGLAAGSRVVSVGAQKLDAGLTVRAIERAPEQAPASAPAPIAKSSP
jgi:RND family efflux transporter MFP subunit